MLEVATVSDWALIGFRVFFRSFVKYGTKPHFRAARCRSPLCGCRRTTGATLAGAMFHVGWRLGSRFTVPNRRAMKSGGRKLA
jgi:hypothetical protein